MTKEILIVEDEFIVADDLQLTLQQAGYTVCGIADSVAEAKEAIALKKPSLVLLDIHLKGKQNGIHLAKELAAQNIAFIFLSANSNQKILEQAKATEPYGFLVKPFREKDLLLMIEIAFYRHEHSLESNWRRELLLQKEFYKIEQSNIEVPLKLLQITKCLQQHIPFDFIAFKMRIFATNEYADIGFLRTGFDEYQQIGLQELSVISGLKLNPLKEMFANAPVDYVPIFHNKMTRESPQLPNTTRTFFATAFAMCSDLIFPVIASDGSINGIGFFRRSEDGFNMQQLTLLSRMHLPLSSVFESLSRGIHVTISDYKKHLDKRTYPNGAQEKFKGIIGSSSALLNVLDLVTQVAPVDTSILILGESGTGKEKVATAIHELSPRKNKPFIKINCSALPPTLIESELFGHEKGAFTNAMERHIGKFELADTGTIFLDEIGDLPLDLQVKLLRVLQEKEIERVGGKQPIKLDVRVVAATNRNLQTEMAQGRFRLDLYYRLNVFPITLPSLCDRKEDIKELAEHFAHFFARKFDKPYKRIGDEMLSQLQLYDFPGNIRELENIIEKSVILSDSTTYLELRQPLVTHKPEKIVFSSHINSVKTIDDFKHLQRQTEIDYISSVLTKTHGRIRGKDGAAELLNEKPTTLESRMQKLGIKKEHFQ